MTPSALRPRNDTFGQLSSVLSRALRVTSTFSADDERLAVGAAGQHRIVVEGARDVGDAEVRPLDGLGPGQRQATQAAAAQIVGRDRRMDAAVAMSAHRHALRHAHPLHQLGHVVALVLGIDELDPQVGQDQLPRTEQRPLDGDLRRPRPEHEPLLTRAAAHLLVQEPALLHGAFVLERVAVGEDQRGHRGFLGEKRLERLAGPATARRIPVLDGNPLEAFVQVVALGQRAGVEQPQVGRFVAAAQAAIAQAAFVALVGRAVLGRGRQGRGRHNQGRGRQPPKGPRRRLAKQCTVHVQGPAKHGGVGEFFAAAESLGNSRKLCGHAKT